METIRSVRDDLAQLEKFAVLARVHFGPDTEKALLAVLRVYDDIIMAARMLIMSFRSLIATKLRCSSVLITRALEMRSHFGLAPVSQSRG